MQDPRTKYISHRPFITHSEVMMNNVLRTSQFPYNHTWIEDERFNGVRKF